MDSVPTAAAGWLERPDGAVVAYEAAGEGPALLFAHGLGGNQLSWWQQLAHFAPAHRCVAFSHRGFAPSRVPGGVPDPSAYAGDALALLDHLGITRAVLVCQSMGGWTGVELALAAPDRVAGLVLASTTGSLAFDQEPDAELVGWNGWAADTVAALEAAGVHRAAGFAMAEESPALLQLYGQVDRLNAGLDKAEVSRRIRALRRRGRDDAARIRCPVLVVAGEEDCVIPPRGMEIVAGRLPDARFTVVPASGHSVYFERAALFNALVGRFLAEIGWT